MFRKTAAIYAAIWSNFRELRELSGRAGVLMWEPPQRINCRSIRSSKKPPEKTSMTITAGHLPAIVALIAGVLILIMPRLVGMGLLRWLHL